MGDPYKRILDLAQQHASDVIKRRWPNRHIGKPVINRKDCYDQLVEMGAISKDIIAEAGSWKVALVYWVLARVEVKVDKDKATDNSFYRSSAWRKLRYSILANSSNCCAACGARSSDGARLHVDHIKPRSKYPEFALDPNNLQVLCEDCNIGKGDSDNL